MTRGPDTRPAPWQTLDRGTVKVTALLLAAAAALGGVPTVIALASAGSLGTALAWVVPCALLLVGGGTLADDLRWRRTRFRVLPDAVEVRSGVLVARRRRVARSRIRTVDLHAHPLLRAFGLVRVSVGSGERGARGADGGTLVLDPVGRLVGEELRATLLEGATHDGRSAERVATWRPGWVRFAPASVATGIFAAVVVAQTFQLSDWFGRGSLPIEVVAGLAARHGPWPVAIVGALLVLVVSSALAVGLCVELWWRYRLELARDHTVRVERGLLTRRSLTLEERRVRGLDLVEPLGARLAGAARVDVVATGLDPETAKSADTSTLLPAAPRTIAVGVVERLGGEPFPSLAPHPAGALARRMRWGLSVGLALALGWCALMSQVPMATPWVVTTALATVAAIGALAVWAWDAARSLGHTLTDGHLVVRRGSVRRSTVLLRREGIVGWRVRQSVFQRRAGLATLVAVSAGGRGRYPVVDGDEHELLAVAAAAVPGLVTPFLAGGASPGPDPRGTGAPAGVTTTRAPRGAPVPRTPTAGG
ncbi:PH domain-containing protein [Isoptericola sp. NPDC019693]|uniref:PH domain-containing protein n=1 Tax=Isoptericola sp. NPDC019693 TaxID=3364009 RepID=UPI00379E12C8